MRELAGKGWRVLGYFIWMLGVGVYLDSDASGAGAALLLIGGSMFAVGAVQSLNGADAPARRSAPAPEGAGEAGS